MNDLTAGSAPSQLQSVLEKVDFPFLPRGQVGEIGTRGRGVCDANADYYSLRQAVEPYRTHTQFLFLPVVAGAISIPAGQQWSPLFNTGTDEQLVNTPVVFPASLTGSLAETNADAGGALVKLDNKFFCTHVMFEYQRPFSVSAQAPTTKQLDTWIESYRTRLYEACMDGVFYRMVFGDQGCQYDLDTAREWPTWGGPYGNQDAQRNGAGSGVGNIVPLRRLVLTGSRDSNDQLKVTTQFSQIGASINADPIVPIPDGITAVIQPVKMTICGFPHPWASAAQANQVADQMMNDPTFISAFKRKLGLPG